MSVAASPNSRLRSMGLMLAFLALWLKLAVPLGFMPTASAGGPVFEMCSTSAAKALGKSRLPQDMPTKAGGECVYSLLHESALAAEDLAAPGVVIGQVTTSISPPPAAAPPRDGLFAPPPPSHAPPTFSA